MALTPSTMLPLGTSAPPFALSDAVSGRELTLGAVKGAAGTLVMFICNHCPYVKHVNGQLVQLATDYGRRGIGLVAISANDAANYPEDGPDKMREYAQRLGYAFPYLHDESQAVAKAYRAACTPDFFLFGADLKLVYRGQLDDSRPGAAASTGWDLRAALDALLAGKPVSADQKPSMGCNIKWKSPCHPEARSAEG